MVWGFTITHWLMDRLCGYIKQPGTGLQRNVCAYYRNGDIIRVGKKKMRLLLNPYVNLVGRKKGSMKKYALIQKESDLI